MPSGLGLPSRCLWCWYLRGPGLCRPYPALAEACSQLQRPGTSAAGLGRGRAQWLWFSELRAVRGVGGLAVVPQGSLAAAAEYQQGSAGLNYDTCPCSMALHMRLLLHHIVMLSYV